MKDRPANPPSAPSRFERVLGHFIALTNAQALVVACAATCIGAAAHWMYWRHGLYWHEGRFGGPPASPAPNAGAQYLLVTLIAVLVSLPITAFVAQWTKRLLFKAAPLYGVTLRVGAFASLGGLGRLVPFVGTAVAVLVTFWLAVGGMRSAFGLRTAEAVVAMVVTTIVVTLLGLSIGFAVGVTRAI